MLFTPQLRSATLIRRYKRFLADVRFEDGTETTVHCPNTGAMLGCDRPGSRVWLSHSSNPKRKYPLTWEIVETESGVRVGINTARTNRLVEEALNNHQIAELQPFQDIRREVRVADGRLDFSLIQQGLTCYLEVKNVTAAVTRGMALFPDARSERASRHVRTLQSLVSEGHRGVLLFCVQREDVDFVRPAGEIDPEYAKTLSAAADAGVEILAYRWTVGADGISLDRSVGVLLE